MNQILSLREKRAKLWNDTKAFLDSHRDGDGMVSAEDNATYEKMEADVVALGKEIERLERQAAIDRELDQPTASPLVSAPIARTPEDVYKRQPYDIIKGAFFICGLGEEDFCSISDELAEKYAERFRWPEMFMRTVDGHVLWVRLAPGETPHIIA